MTCPDKASVNVRSASAWDGEKNAEFAFNKSSFFIPMESMLRILDVRLQVLDLWNRYPSLGTTLRE